MSEESGSEWRVKALKTVEVGTNRYVAQALVDPNGGRWYGVAEIAATRRGSRIKGKMMVRKDDAEALAKLKAMRSALTTLIKRLEA